MKCEVKSEGHLQEGSEGAAHKEHIGMCCPAWYTQHCPATHEPPPKCTTAPPATGPQGPTYAMLCCSPSACACTTVVAAAWSRRAAGLTRRARAARPPAAAACCPARAPAAALGAPLPATPAGQAAAPPLAGTPAGAAPAAAAPPPVALPVLLLPPFFIFLLGEVSVPSGAAVAAGSAAAAALRFPGDVPAALAAAAAAGAGAGAGLLRTEGLPPAAACCFWLPASAFCCGCRRLAEELRCESSEPAGLTAARCLAAAGWAPRAVLPVVAAFCCRAPPAAVLEALPAAVAGALAVPARRPLAAPPPPFEAGLATGAVDRGFTASWPSGKKKGSLELRRKDCESGPCCSPPLLGSGGDARLLLRRLNVRIER